MCEYLLTGQLPVRPGCLQPTSPRLSKEFRVSAFNLGGDRPYGSHRIYAKTSCAYCVDQKSYQPICQTAIPMPTGSLTARLHAYSVECMVANIRRISTHLQNVNTLLYLQLSLILFGAGLQDREYHGINTHPFTKQNVVYTAML